VDTTSRATNWSRGLSPFILGPCKLWGGHVSRTMENAWQYSKVYAEHTRLVAPRIDARTSEWAQNFQPTFEVRESWLVWAQAGWANVRAVRYPMGKGGPTPLFSYWDGMRFGYLEARQRIYLPLYWAAVYKTVAFSSLVDAARAAAVAGRDLVLRDFDGYDWRAAGLPSLDAVITNPARKMGHAFVLALMLKEMGIE